ncbi:MAG: hypothetical protein FIB08_03705 [Candidatus Methanoperedens sp.]|nr:hypothetical protein [Candidatus Methanoperedens sp.]
MKKIFQSACTVCTHKDRDEIDKLLLEGILTQRAIAKQFGCTEQAISGHRRKHVISPDIEAKLREIAVQSIIDGKMVPGNTTEWIKLADYLKDNKTQLDCANCQYKKPRKEFGEIIKDFLNEADDATVTLSIESDIFESLKKIKGEGEDYSQLINRLIGKASSN